jgi:hypothetical protein
MAIALWIYESRLPKSTAEGASASTPSSSGSSCCGIGAATAYWLSRLDMLPRELKAFWVWIALLGAPWRDCRSLSLHPEPILPRKSTCIYRAMDGSSCSVRRRLTRSGSFLLSCSANTPGGLGRGTASTIVVPDSHGSRGEDGDRADPTRIRGNPLVILCLIFGVWQLVRCRKKKAL